MSHTPHRKYSEKRFLCPSFQIGHVSFPSKGQTKGLVCTVYMGDTNGEDDKKKPFSPEEDFTPLWWHSGTQKLVRIVNEARRC